MDVRLRPRAVPVQTTRRSARPSAFPLGAFIRLALVLALLPTLLTLSALSVYRDAHDDVIYPGVSVMGVDLSRQSREQARASLLAHVATLGRRPFVLRYEDLQFRTTMGAMGLALPDRDLERAVNEAMRAGREEQFQPWLRSQLALLQRGHRLPLTLGLDRERARLTLVRIAEEIDRAPVNAELSLERAGAGFEVHTKPAEAGRRLNLDATLQRLQQAVTTGVPDALQLVVEQTQPAIGDADVVEARTTLTRVLGSPLVFQRDDRRTWSIEPAALFDVVEITGLETGRPPVSVVVHEPKLAKLVLDVISEADQPAENAKLEVQGDQVVTRPGRPGRLIDREAAVREAMEQVTPDRRTVELKMVEDLPWVLEEDLALVREKANRLLGIPLALEFSDQRWVLERKDLGGFLSLPDTQALPRPTATPVSSAPAANAPSRVATTTVAPTPTTRTATATPVSRAAVAPTASAAAARAQATPGPAPAANQSARAGLDLPVTLDQEKVKAYLTQWVAAWVARAPEDAALELKNRRYEIRAGRPGIGIDFSATAADMATRFLMEDPAARTVSVRLVSIPPAVGEQDLIKLREITNMLVGQPIMVRSPVGEWTIAVDELLAMLRFQGTAPNLTPFLSRERLVERVEAIRREAESRAAGAGLRDASGQPRQVDVLMTTAAVWASAQSNSRETDLQWAEEEPA